MTLRSLLKPLLPALLLATTAPLPAATGGESRSLDAVSYFSALSNLASPIMFGGFGEPLITSPYERDQWLRRAGFVTRPPMPDIPVVGAVYRSALPVFRQTPDYSRPETLAWDDSTFDRTLDPGAQAWTLIKITSPRFHLQFHDLPDNRLAALMMVPQAREQAGVLAGRLRDADGLFAPRGPDGSFQAATPADQAAVLWGASNLILAATRDSGDYWHQAYRDLVDADDYRPLADSALQALDRLPPTTAPDLAIAIEALGRYTLIAADAGKRDRARARARDYGNRLQRAGTRGTTDLAAAIYGLTEAGRLLGDDGFGAAAGRLSGELLGRWEPEQGLFRNGTGEYTPRDIGFLAAALNAMRWYGRGDVAERAGRLHPRFLQGMILDSGLLRASPRALISPPYLQNPTVAAFDRLPDPAQLGQAPVFVSRVRRQEGGWQVTDPRFSMAGAQFLGNMLALRTGGEADIFLPPELLDGE
ncbi:MAG TPA: hypothetical protein ENI96_07130 [Sedimenticola thiotaurini]|uniref:Uncharacterized protein n=1 Tax=Sedimenticola thiotaurini TaxID=1543721 RepID=A0A831WAI6_9GAMM|nr:hypothetical protein [Sedimenticola thiotaurini]